jgi:hypothetical protein
LIHANGIRRISGYHGFSALLSGDDHADRVNNYLICLREILEDKGGMPQIEYVVFSDSIVIATTDNTEASFQGLLKRCSTVFGALLAREIPVRGAVAHGTYVSEKTDSGRFVAGRAIIDAYQFEGEQDWVGIMLSPSVIRQFPDLGKRCLLNDPHTDALLSELTNRLPWAAFVQPCGQIPFHGGPDYHGFAIVPSNGGLDVAELRDSLLRSVASLQRLKSLAPSPQTQLKHQRTMNWLSQIQMQWQLAAFRRDQLKSGFNS